MSDTKTATCEPFNDLFRPCGCEEKTDVSETQSVKSQRIKRKKKSGYISVEYIVLWLAAAIFLCVGICLLSITLWSFARKIYVYTRLMEIMVDMTFFTAPAGLLCFPSVVLAILLTSHKLRYMLMFMSLQVIAIIVLSTGYSLGTVYRMHFTNETVQLQGTIPREALNHTLSILIANYEVYGANDVLDGIQSGFSCCGIDGKNDFIDVPSSCCPRSDCEDSSPYENGCLRSIQIDVAWHKNITSSVTELFLLMYVFMIVMTVSIYVSDHFKWLKFRAQQQKQTS